MNDNVKHATTYGKLMSTPLLFIIVALFNEVTKIFISELKNAHG